MLLEFGGYTYTPGALECVSDVRKSPVPGDFYELRIRTCSGLEVCKRFPTKGGAEKCRDELLTYLRR